LRAARGRIVNVSSISGRVALPFIAPYAASKHALAALSESLRVELAPWGMHVALVEPGNVRTPIWRKSLAEARTLRAGMPAVAEQHYGPALDALSERVGRVQDISPEQVAERFERALTAARPRARYPIGRDLRILALLDRLPWRWRDRLIQRALPEWGLER
jgi:NAD(P)-dependent dehydrogenase (short-subunit alcohol dehydrogenase family)